MTAGDVVGEDLELGLVHHLALVGQDETGRHHLAVGLLGRLLDDDLALEHTRGLAIHHGLEQLAADAAGGGMVGQEGGVRELLAVEHGRAVHHRAGIGPGEVQVDLMPGEHRAHHDVHGFHRGLGPELHG